MEETHPDSDPIIVQTPINNYDNLQPNVDSSSRPLDNPRHQNTVTYHSVESVDQCKFIPPINNKSTDNPEVMKVESSDAVDNELESSNESDANVESGLININCTDNPEVSSDGLTKVERSNESENGDESNVNAKSDLINCTRNFEVSLGDSTKEEGSNTVDNVFLDTEDHIDLCNEIPNFYRLLDLCKDTGSIGFSVDKIIISQKFLMKLCNDMVPNSFKSISKIDYTSLDSKSLGLVGIYGDRETIARYLLRKNTIDERIHNLLVKPQTNNDGTKTTEPHLKPGIYLLIEKEHGLVIHWPEEDCYSVRASSQRRRNLINLHRYLTKLTNIHFCLMSAKDLGTFDFNPQNKYIGDEYQICCDYNVEEQMHEEDFDLSNGFKLNLVNTRMWNPEEIELPTSFPPAMPIESCYNQSFITYDMIRPREVIKEREDNVNTDKLGLILNSFKDYRLKIDPSIDLNGLINLTKALSIGSKLIKLYEDEIEKVNLDNKKEEEEEDNIIKVDSFILSSMLRSKINNMYGLSEETQKDEPSQKDITRIDENYPDVIDLPHLQVGNINSEKWKTLKECYLVSQSLIKKQELTTEEGEKFTYDILTKDDKKSIKHIAMKILKKIVDIDSLSSDYERASKEIPKVTDQQFVQNLFSTDKNSEIGQKIISLFVKEYTTWKNQMCDVSSLYQFIKCSRKVQNLLEDLKSRFKEIEKKYLEKIREEIQRTSDFNSLNFFEIKAFSKKRDDLYNIKYTFTQQMPSQVKNTIYETQLDVSQAESLRKDSEYVPTLDLKKTTNLSVDPVLELKYIYQIKSGTFFLFFWSKKSLSLKFYVCRSGHIKSPMDFPGLNEDSLVAINETLGLIALYEIKTATLHIYEFEENPLGVFRKSNVQGISIEKPDILKFFFLQITEDLCFVEKNEVAKIYELKTNQFRPRFLKLPHRVINVLCSPNGLCIVALASEELSNEHIVKAHVYFAPKFESPAQKVITLPFGIYEAKYCQFSLLCDEQVHLSFANLKEKRFESRLVKISVEKLEVRLQKQAIKLSLGRVKVSDENSSKVIGKETYFLRDVKPGDFVIIMNEKKQVSDIINDNLLEVVDHFSATINSDSNSWFPFEIEPKPKSNSLIDIYSDVYEKFPINPCIDGGLNKSPLLLIFPETFADNIETNQVQKLSENFKDYVDRMCDKIKVTTRKPAILLNKFSVHIKSYQDLLDPVIIQNYAPKFRLGEWIIQLCCLIPIQIAVVKQGRLFPLRDGLDTPENYDPDYNDDDCNCTERISREISFGWYEGIFSHLGKREVKVVSSMGEQSCGKSYMINHLVGTNFDASAMRCTEGAWMSLSITEKTIHVALDFEGVKSIERTAQEDLLLNILNASLSDLILFKNQFAINRDMSSMFHSFQDGANLLMNESKFFKAKLCVIIKDVPMADRKGIKYEFEQKLREIVRKEGKKNFISRFYSGKTKIYAWPMFNDLEWYNTLNMIKEQIDGSPPEYHNAHYFLEYIRTMLAKLKMFDWNPLDEALIYKRVTTLRRLLNSAVNMGIEQTEPFVRELLDRSTGTNIPDTEKLLSDIFKNDTPFPADSKLVLYEERSSFIDLSRELVGFFEKLYKQRKNVEKDEIWFNNLLEFLEFIIKRRTDRVETWFKQNTKEFSQDSSHIVQGNSLLQQKISELKIFWNFCGIKCSKCKLHCMKQRNHNEDHDCFTNHKCGFTCQFVSQHVEQDGQQVVCKHEAGHDGKHVCSVMQHLCSKPCHLSDKGNCSKYCSRDVEHSEQLEHLCQSTQHQCGASCSLKTNQHECPNICIMPHDKPHGVHEHRCQDNLCPIICPMENCNRRCQSTNHLHSLEAPDIDHFCGDEHQCLEECQAPGICRTECIEKEDEIYRGILSEIPYTKCTQIKKTLPCCKKIPPNLRKHEGIHIHEENAKHICDVKCPFCSYYCSRDYGHSELHHTSHGNMNNTVFSAKNDEFEYDGYRLKTGDQGTFVICNMYCKKARRHRHIDYCKNSDHFRNENGIQHIDGIIFNPYPELPKDFLSHEQFWARTGFEDPYSVLEQEDFKKCDAECPDKIHKSNLSNDIHPEKSYCDLPLFHKHQNTLPPGFAGYLSNGHLFPCRDPRVAAFHIIFVLDRSSSMKSGDQIPISDTLFVKMLRQNHKNRFGAALDATDCFIRARASSIRNQNMSMTVVDDIVSTIFFNEKPEIIFENESILNTDFIRGKMIMKNSGGGTDFERAMEMIDEIIDKHFDQSRFNVVMFLSDGECSVPRDKLIEICQKNKERGSPLYLNTVLFGNDLSIESPIVSFLFGPNDSNFGESLKEMAEIAQTYHENDPHANQRQCQYTNAIDSIQLIECFSNVVKSLLDYKPMLIQKK